MSEPSPGVVEAPLGWRDRSVMHRGSMGRVDVVAGTFHHQIPRDAPVHVAGHRGLVGGAIWRHLTDEGFTGLVGRSSKELDLRDRDAVFDFYNEAQPDYTILAAAKVGGILANATQPAEFLSD